MQRGLEEVDLVLVAKARDFLGQPWQELSLRLVAESRCLQSLLGHPAFHLPEQRQVGEAKDLLCVSGGSLRHDCLAPQAPVQLLLAVQQGHLARLFPQAPVQHALAVQQEHLP